MIQLSRAYSARLSSSTHPHVLLFLLLRLPSCYHHPGTNAGAFAFMVLYLCVSLRSDWNEVTGLPLLEKVKTSSIIFSIITTATAMVE